MGMGACPGAEAGRSRCREGSQASFCSRAMWLLPDGANPGLGSWKAFMERRGAGGVGEEPVALQGCA